MPGQQSLPLGLDASDTATVKREILSVKQEEGRIWSPLRRKWLLETPEERVRQEFLCVLVNEYQFTLDQIGEEVEVTGRGAGRARADFVIWRTNEVFRGTHGYETHETIAFGQGWGFRSLLGAMYFQMMIYMREGGGWRICKRPDCDLPVSFESSGDPRPKSGSKRKHRTHSNKAFCSSACRQWWSDNFGNSKKAQAKRGLQQARAQREDGHQ